jgi:hypothetical protein
VVGCGGETRNVYKILERKSLVGANIVLMFLLVTEVCVQ